MARMLRYLRPGGGGLAAPADHDGQPGTGRGGAVTMAIDAALAK